MEKRLSMFLACLFLSLGMALAQTQISGTVVSQEDGEPIVGASILVVGTKMGAVSDVEDKFKLTLSEGHNQIRVQYVGMKTKVVTAKNGMHVVLESDSKTIDEVIVTGYGVVKRSAFTGSATTIDGKLISNKTDANPIKALEGSVPGLQLNVSSGQPGAPATIFIRGRNSLNSSTQPLYVVDGVPYSSDAVGIRSREGQEVSPLASLNPNDIESINVLKDATATSIYGARAANGVIVITTKHGGSSKTKVSFSARVGVEMMPAYKHFNYGNVSASQYQELISEGFKNSIAKNGDNSPSKYYFDTYIGGDINDPAKQAAFFNDVLYDSKMNAGNNTKWIDEVTRNGLTQNYNLTIQGGAPDVRAPKYYLSADYFNDKAIVIGKDMKRYSFRLNLEQAPSRVVKWGLNTSVTYSETNMGAGGGYFSDPITQALMLSPWEPVYNADGTWNMATSTTYNPVAERSKYGDQSLAKQYRILVSPYVQINFTPDLFWMTRGGADIMLVDEFGYWSFLQPQGADMHGHGEDANTTRTLMSLTHTLNYQKTFNEVHNVNFMLGQETQYTYYKRAYLAGSNYPTMDKPQVSNASVPGSAATEVRRIALASFFANAEYNYVNKYYASASLRFDGSSRFGNNNRWGTFYSLGAKYRISEENFMANTREWLDNLTFRISYGTSGNSEVGASWYASRDLYGFGYNYNAIPGSLHEQFGNADLKWERTGKFNIGLDFNFLKRFSFSFDYYNHRTSDMVFAVPTSFITGLDEYYKNVGELQNRGFEMTFGASIFNTNDLKWDASLTVSHNKNKVIKLSTDQPIEGTYQITEAGRPIYQFKMKEYAGVDPKTGEAQWYLNDTGNELTKNYNKAAKRYVGDANPKLEGGLNSNLTWKDLDFSFQFTYSFGRKIYGNNLRYDEQTGSSFGKNFSPYVYKNRWQKEGDVTDVPAIQSDDLFKGSSANKASSRYLMNGDYVKLRNITLGYTLPRSLTEKVFISRLRVYISADNFYTWGSSKYRGFDPSGIDANGVQWWNFPNPRNVVFGVNVNF
nr:TonB-dependent receptor [uncultured Prevotella sp.]